MDRSLEQRLLSERQRLQRAIKQKTDAAAIPLSEMTDELSMYDQHSGDLGSATFEREKNAGLQEMLEAKLMKVNEALNKLQSGKYGICDWCGQPIDPQRLAKLPSAKLCITCARKEQDRFVRSPEEKTLNIHEIQEKGGEFQVAGYELFDEYGLSQDDDRD